MVGTFHKVSAKYLPLYVAEFQFRYNNRDNADIFGAVIAGMLISLIKSGHEYFASKRDDIRQLGDFIARDVIRN